MSQIADMVRTLIEAGTPPDIAAVVVTEAFAAGATVRGHSADKVDEQAERRRQKDRERKRSVRGHSAESADIPQTSERTLILKKDNKKVSKPKTPLSADWQPSEDHFAYGANRGYSRDQVLEKVEDMRIWAGSNNAVKADWGLTLLGFLRRDTPKPISRAGPSKAVAITPASPSWNAWKAHFRDAGKNFQAAHMDKLASDGKAFTVQSEWPPEAA